MNHLERILATIDDLPLEQVALVARHSINHLDMLQRKGCQKAREALENVMKTQHPRLPAG